MGRFSCECDVLLPPGHLSALGYFGHWRSIERGQVGSAAGRTRSGSASCGTDQGDGCDGRGVIATSGSPGRGPVAAGSTRRVARSTRWLGPATAPSPRPMPSSEQNGLSRKSRSGAGSEVEPRAAGVEATPERWPARRLCPMWRVIANRGRRRSRCMARLRSRLQRRGRRYAVLERPGAPQPVSGATPIALRRRPCRCRFTAPILDTMWCESAPRRVTPGAGEQLVRDASQRSQLDSDRPGPRHPHDEPRASRPSRRHRRGHRGRDRPPASSQSERHDAAYARRQRAKASRRPCAPNRGRRQPRPGRSRRSLVRAAIRAAVPTPALDMEPSQGVGHAKKSSSGGGRLTR